MVGEQRPETPGAGSGAEVPETPAADRISHDIRERMSSLRPQAADSVDHAADAARQAADRLRGEETWMAQLVEQGADKLSDLAGTLRGSDLEGLLGKTEDFARRQPVLFTGAAIAVGFALTRAAAAAARSNAVNPTKRPTETAPETRDRSMMGAE